jgi:TonB-dependent SusC/RagA subfamily outer membrane receptor
MPMSQTLARNLGGLVLIASVGCGAPGLPPAGPAPGEVDIGYGTRDERDVTGAVSSVDDEQLGNVRPLQIEDLLRGRVAGLQIVPSAGGGYTFRIRGTNSIMNDQPPLFVVDGIQVSAGGLTSALAGLTTKDIRQVDVLKDVSSTSIYGSRGAGGVILITTRR